MIICHNYIDNGNIASVISYFYVMSVTIVCTYSFNTIPRKLVLHVLWHFTSQAKHVLLMFFQSHLDMFSPYFAKYQHHAIISVYSSYHPHNLKLSMQSRWSTDFILNCSFYVYVLCITFSLIVYFISVWRMFLLLGSRHIILFNSTRNKHIYCPLMQLELWNGCLCHLTLWNTQTKVLSLNQNYY